MDLLIANSVQHNDGSNSEGGPSHQTSPLNVVSLVKDISLGFPYFDGSTPVLEWIFKAEKFFSYHNTPDASHVDIAIMHFDKDVVPWFQMLQQLAAVSTWSELTKALDSQIGPSLFDNPMAELFKLQQTGYVSEYYLQFMSLANRSIGLSEDAFFNCFISGLDPDIRRDVIVMTPSTLLRAVALAKLYEEKYNPTVKTIKINFVQRYSQLSSNTKYPTQAKSVTKTQLPPLLPTPPGPPLKTSNVKCISPAEMQLHREKGICYFCDDKFTFNHRCPNK